MNKDVVAGGTDSGRGEFDVAYIAELARLQLSAEETALFQSQLGQVMEHAARLQDLNLDGVEPAAHTVPAFNVFREDEVRASLSQEEALRNAPRSVNGLFIVPKVLE